MLDGEDLRAHATLVSCDAPAGSIVQDNSYRGDQMWFGRMSKRSGRFRACMFQNATARRSSEETGSLTSPDCLGKPPFFASTAILMVSRCKTRRSKSSINNGEEMAEEFKENRCLFCKTKQRGVSIVTYTRPKKDNSQRKPCQAPSVSI